jgi:hypothetical protein
MGPKGYKDVVAIRRIPFMSAPFLTLLICNHFSSFRKQLLFVGTDQISDGELIKKTFAEPSPPLPIEFFSAGMTK